MEEKVEAPFAGIRDHVLLPWASGIGEASRVAHERLSEGVLAGILAKVPDGWMDSADGAGDAEERRGVYVDFLTRRLAGSAAFEEEAMRALQL